MGGYPSVSLVADMHDVELRSYCLLLTSLERILMI